MTAYDALFGRLVDESGVDAILVGDSVGTAIMGYASTLPVTLDHMIYHASAVRRGVKRALIIIDMPFLSYQASIESAVLNCGRAIQETGVAAVKVEGGGPEMLDTVHALVRTRIPAAVGIPTIGIGAGAQCDGQVLVLPDVLGLNDTFQPKFLLRYAEMANEVRLAIGNWADDVRRGAYPDREHSF